MQNCKNKIYINTFIFQGKEEFFKVLKAHA